MTKNKPPHPKILSRQQYNQPLKKKKKKDKYKYIL